MDYITIITIQSVMFVFIMTVFCFFYHAMMKGADARLKQANEMVNTLAHSCDTLSKTNTEIKDLALNVKRDYTKQIDEINKLHAIEVKELTTNRDDFKHAYNALLEKYNRLDAELIDGYKRIQESHFRTIHDMATKPTISNNNSTETHEI